MWMLLIWFYENDLYEIGISYIRDTVVGKQERKPKKVIRKSTPETYECLSEVDFLRKDKPEFNQIQINQIQIYMKFRITNCCTQLESSGCFCVS